MILFAHNRYRVPGGEERVVADLMWLVREKLGRPAELLACDSAGLSRGRAARQLLRGGARPAEVGAAVRRSGAAIVHAHNLHPQLGWRALAAAREAGARVVLHLHQYRLVCAVGVCFTDGVECQRCHARNTLPGVIHRCRGGVVEAAVYGAALALWQRRIMAQADAVIVPSRAALQRLEGLGAPLPDRDRVHVLAPVVRALEADGLGVAGEAGTGAGPRSCASRGSYALLVSRISPEKGVDVAMRACLAAGRPLVIAGDGPDLGRLREQARRTGAPEGSVRFLGAVPESELARLRGGAALALAPSRSAETFGLAAAEAMAAGLPLVASDVGFLSELLAPDCLVAPGDVDGLAAAVERLWGDERAGAEARRRVAARCAPETVASGLSRVYERVLAP